VMKRAWQFRQLGARLYARSGLNQTSETLSEHNELIQQQFTQQAARGFDNQSASSDRMLSWIRSALPLQPFMRVLDVAAGTGRMSRTVAPFVREVVAVDITKGMLEVGKEQAQKAGIQNIEWITANAQEIPLSSESFDLVVARLAVHHWLHPQPIVNEMARLCKRGGNVVLIDIIVPDTYSEELGQRYNYLERLRDPSHTNFLYTKGLKDLLLNAMPTLKLSTTRSGMHELGPGVIASIDNTNCLDTWMNLTAPKDDTCREIKQAVEQELNGGPATGLAPRIDPTTNEILFQHNYVMVMGDRI